MMNTILNHVTAQTTTVNPGACEKEWARKAALEARKAALEEKVGVDMFVPIASSVV